MFHSMLINSTLCTPYGQINACPDLSLTLTITLSKALRMTWKGVEPELENKQNKTNRVKVNSKSK